MPAAMPSLGREDSVVVEFVNISGAVVRTAHVSIVGKAQKSGDGSIGHFNVWLNGTAESVTFSGKPRQIAAARNKLLRAMGASEAP